MKPTSPAPTLPGRRQFLRSALTAGAAAAALPMALATRARAEDEVEENPILFTTQDVINPAAALAQDLYVLSFALNLEYLEAQYYALAYYGETIEQRGVKVSGAGAQGSVVIKPNPRVPFAAGGAIEQYAAEIANDEINHVTFLRRAIQGTGTIPPAIPAIDLLNSFNALAQAAGLGDSFDPFESEKNFLLGAFIFEDVGVTAYRGGAKLLSNTAYIKAAAGILAVEALHAGTVRAILFDMGDEMRAAAQAISDVRDKLDGGKEKDQGLLDDAGNANLVPTDSDGLCLPRSARQVLNIVYGSVGAQRGGFFPAGANLLVPFNA